MRFAPELKAKWNSFNWPGMQWCREVNTRLYEADFARVPASVERKATMLGNAMRTSLAAENGGNRLQARQRQHVAGKMAKVEKYHCLLNSSVLPEFGRPTVQATAAAEESRPKKIPESTFSAKSWSHSLGGQFDLLGQGATWPNHTHEVRMNGFLSFAAFVKLQGDWRRHYNLWPGLLGVCNHLIFKTGAPMQSGLVSFNLFFET